MNKTPPEFTRCNQQFIEHLFHTMRCWTHLHHLRHYLFLCALELLYMVTPTIKTTENKINET